MDHFSHQYFIEYDLDLEEPKRVKTDGFKIPLKYLDQVMLLIRICVLVCDLDSLYATELMRDDFIKVLSKDELEELGKYPRARVTIIDTLMIDWLDKAVTFDPLNNYTEFKNHMSMKNSTWSKTERYLIALRFFSSYGDAISITSHGIMSLFTEWLGSLDSVPDEWSTLLEQLDMFNEMYEEYINFEKLNTLFYDLIDGKESQVVISDEEFGEDGLQIDYDFIVN